MPESAKTPDPDKEKRRIRAVKKMKEIMTAYYIEAKTAAQNGKKVAWITSGGPVEPLIAMDVIPVYPENHGAMIGAAKMGVDLCEKAEAMGYARDLCSYARADIACAPIDGGPIGGLPRPDMLVCCNNICGTVLKWYEVQARRFRVPLFILDTPFCHTEFSDEARRYVRRQIDEYLAFLEAEAPGFHPDPGFTDLFDKVPVEAIGLFGRGGLDERRAPPLAAVSQERELGHHQHRAAGVDQGAVEPALPILENPQAGDLLRQEIGCPGVVVAGHPEEHQEAGADPPHGLRADPHAGLADPLDHRAHNAHFLFEIQIEIQIRCWTLGVRCSMFVTISIWTAAAGCPDPL